MKLDTIAKQFQTGAVDKQEYIARMYNIHKTLFNYAEYLRDTDISKIEITDFSVMMTSRKSGIKMLCPMDKRTAPIEILNFNAYEPDLLAMAFKLIERESTIFDIGANMGWYTLNIAKALEGVKIYAFEPIASTFSYLKYNVELNKLENVILNNFGFSDTEQELTFYYDPENSGNTSLKEMEKGRSLVQCRVKTLDNYFASPSIKCDFIKCDVEGAELLVYKGGVNFLSRCRPIIMSEMLRKWTAKFDYHPNDIIELLSGIGYQCFVVTGEKLREFFDMDETTVETNFFFLHSEKHNEIIKEMSE